MNVWIYCPDKLSSLLEDVHNYKNQRGCVDESFRAELNDNGNI